VLFKLDLDRYSNLKMLIVNNKHNHLNPCYSYGIKEALDKFTLLYCDDLPFNS